MIKVKFKDSKDYINASFARIGEHVVSLVGDVPQDKSGFDTYKADESMHLGDFYDYVTIYRIIDGAVQFSNDGSVWVDPPEPPTPPEPEPIPYEPSLEERVNDLEIAICEITDELVAVLGE